MSNTFTTSFYPWRNRYLLMRHGHSQANEQGLIISSPGRGLCGFGLSPLGEAQLSTVVDQWRWPTPTKVVHSDFLRTTQTAERVANAFGLTLEKEERLRERYFGELDGQTDRYYPDVWALDAQDADHQQHQVEAVSRVAKRMCAVIEGLERRCDGETVLVVSHGDPLQILLTALANEPLTQHREQPSLQPASITLLGS
ncbi:histidine phosphatase family protein [Vreelandella andesensis]|uniref:Histidine phosphatase family protein n=1 Tax=Vreelandella andesensis TaxID=447567 RepID=A0A433KLC8_9GAMM|nr:histidine phosphatase family protein [Halomonas andesensis]RUR30275.1 histidine phosphatase family protein [Halomonas andesensis]